MAVDELYNQGFQARCEGRYGEARLFLERALELDPFHSDARWQVALILGFEGEFEQSIDALTALVRVNPNVPKYRYDLGMTQMMLGMSDEACENFRVVLEQDPTHEDAMRQLAYC